MFGTCLFQKNTVMISKKFIKITIMEIEIRDFYFVPFQTANTNSKIAKNKSFN